MNAEHTDTVMAEDIISSWRKHAKSRAEYESFHADLFEDRRGFYEDSPTLSQYNALWSYLDCHDFGPIPYASDEERVKAQRGTFGTAYPGATDAELDAALEDHKQAMAKAYDAEIEAALGDVRL